MFIQPRRLELTTGHLNRPKLRLTRDTAHKQTPIQTSRKNGVRRNLSKKKIKTGNEPNAEATHPVPVSSTPPLTWPPSPPETNKWNSANPCSDSPLPPRPPRQKQQSRGRGVGGGGGHVARLRRAVLLGAGIGAAGAGQGRRGSVRVGVERRWAAAAVRRAVLLARVALPRLPPRPRRAVSAAAPLLVGRRPTVALL